MRSPFYQLYPGVELPADKVARIFISGGAAVMRIDNREPSIFELGRLNNVWHYPDVLEVLPGQHKIKVSLESNFLTSQPSAVLSLDARAGHSYIIGLIIYISKRTSKKTWRAVIVDKGTDYEEGVSPSPIYKFSKD